MEHAVPPRSMPSTSSSNYLPLRPHLSPLQRHRYPHQLIYAGSEAPGRSAGRAVPCHRSDTTAGTNPPPRPGQAGYEDEKRASCRVPELRARCGSESLRHAVFSSGARLVHVSPWVTTCPTLFFVASLNPKVCQQSMPT